MKPNKITSLILSSFLFATNVHASEPAACGAILGEEAKSRIALSEGVKVKDPELVYNIKIKKDSRFSKKEVSKEDLVELFQMFGMTQFFNTSEKITLEKGSIYLGQKIDDLLSLQAEYVFDKPNKKLHLTRVSIVNSKNGVEQALSKEPVMYEGSEFIKSDFFAVFEKDSSSAKVLGASEIKHSVSHEDLPTGNFKFVELKKDQLKSAEVLFPIEISGKAFDKVLKWSLIIPHLDHLEINVVDSVSKHNWAITKGQFRRFVEFAKDRFFKQAFGLLVVYAIFDSMNGFSHDIAKYFVHILQTQESSISVKVKETKVDGQVTNTEQKFKIIMPKKKDETKDNTGDEK